MSPSRCLIWWARLVPLNSENWWGPLFLATIGVSWEDGSGTGTGGTINFLNLEGQDEPIKLDIWMGTWNSTVVHSTSNWKEMCTLRQTLQNESNLWGIRVRHCRFIYSTDNSVMCDISRRGVSKSDPLQKLFLEVKLLELQLDCQLLIILVSWWYQERE